MKSPLKRQADAQAKQALDEDPISFSLSPPLKQVKSGSSAKENTQRVGGVTGHGGSMSAHRGPPSLNPLDVVLQSGRQSAADIITQGSSLSAPQSRDAKELAPMLPCRSIVPAGL
jgi:hypothetical protein